MGRKCKVCKLIEDGKDINSLRKSERLTYRKMAVAIKQRFNISVHFSSISKHYKNKHEAKPRYRPPPKPPKKNIPVIVDSYGDERDLWGRKKQKHSKWWRQHVG